MTYAVYCYETGKFLAKGVGDEWTLERARIRTYASKHVANAKARAQRGAVIPYDDAR